MNMNNTSNTAPRSSVLQPPKKSKKRLILGISLGSLAVVGMISAVLLYFLWWQKPEHVVSRALVDLAAADKSLATSKFSLNGQDVNVDIEAKSVMNSPQQKTDVTIKVDTGQPNQAFQSTVQAVYGDDGALYVKADGLRKVADMLADMYTFFGAPRAQGIDPARIMALRQQLKAKVLSTLEPLMEMVDGQWVKLSADDLEGPKQQQVRCMLEAARVFNTNPSGRKELVQLYTQHQFLTVKNTRQADGMTGYEINLDAQPSQERIQAFADDLVQKTSFGKNLKDCLGDDTTGQIKTKAKKSTTQAQAIVLWIGGGQLKKVELTDKDNSTTTIDIQKGATEDIKRPTEFRNAKEVLAEIQNIQRKL